MPNGASGRKVSLIRLLDEHRALLMLAALFALLSAFEPKFCNPDNVTAILRGSCLNGIVAIGFTIVFILGQLDLSIGAVVMLCGMLVIGLQPRLGWAGGAVAAVLAGAGVGLANGLLVVKARINSFIVTLGTMTIVMGLMYLYSKGGSKSVDDFRLGDFLRKPVIWVLSPDVLITLGLVAAFSLFLNHTRVGRGFFLIGGNPETAWLAGLRRDRYVIAGFILCGTMAGAGGTMFAIGLSSMTSYAILGTRTLMTVLAAVIIGGTLMSGGKGSVLKSYLAVLMLTALFNGIGCFGYGFEVQIFVNGVILAVVVLYEAYTIYRQNLLKGQRPDLLREAETMCEEETDEEEQDSDIQEKEEEAMNRKDSTFAYVCVTLTAIVGIVAIFAMYFVHVKGAQPIAVTAQIAAPASPAAVSPGAAAVSQPAETPAADVFALKGRDRQPLILKGEKKPIPPRPADSKALPEEDKGHWWDIEYAGWTTQKVKMPESPKTGPAGKKVVLLKAGDHPYWTAYVEGFQAVADFYKMDAKVYNSNWNMDLQAQQTEQAINERPDMIIFAPVDATACTTLLRRINEAGIPCITTNTIPCDEAMKYCLAWTGPDDWGQFRMLARALADKLGGKGGYAIIRHMPGSSPFYARTFAPITELREYAPDMKMLAMDTSNLEAERTMSLVSAWIKKYGDELKGLVLAGDEFCVTGSLEAMKNAGRMDIVIIAAGNSKIGMDAVKAGNVLAISYQSAQGDGALAVYTAAEWFSGQNIEPVRYLPKHVITKADVENYMPAQW